MKYFSKDIINKIRRGYYSAVYFNRTKDILLKENNLKPATMQIFQKKDGSILCGVEEVTELLKVGVGCWNPPSPPAGGYGKARWVDKSDELEIMSLRDGDRISAVESVMHITGPYVYFAHLESIILGILARRTSVATNVRKVVKAAKGKPVIFFADRFDHFLNQEGDGYAAIVGGVDSVCTEAHGAWFKGEPVGTIPHSLIAVNNGSTLASVHQFHKYYPEVNLIALVDFDNDCVKTSLEVARVFRDRLWGVRLDTASDLIDKSLEIPNPKSQIPSKKELSGVNPYLVRVVREALDREGFKHVKIVVSGGFTAEKINKFSKEKVPVDTFGVGSTLIHGENVFTADIVKVDGKKIAKAGRKYKSNSKLKKIDLKKGVKYEK